MQKTLSIPSIGKQWKELLQQVGPLYGYFPKPSKFYLVVKEQCLENAIETFRGSEIKITTEGKNIQEQQLETKILKLHM